LKGAAMYSIEELTKEEAGYVRKFANKRKSDKALIREISKFYCKIKEFNKEHGTTNTLLSIDSNFCADYILRLKILNRGTGEIVHAQQGTKECVYYQLHSFYSWLVSQNDIPGITVNPFTYVDRPIKDRQPDLKRIYPDHQLRDLFDEIKKNCDPVTYLRDYLIAFLIYITGKKPGQVCNIRLNQLVVDDDGVGGIQFDEKGIVDTALIPKETFEKLLFMISSYGIKKADWINPYPIFVSTRSMGVYSSAPDLMKPISIRHITRVISDSGKLLDMKISSNDLRDHYVIYSALAGASAVNLMDATSVSPVQFVRRYTGVIEQLGKEYISTLNNIRK
jgi:integrase